MAIKNNNKHNQLKISKKIRFSTDVVQLFSSPEIPCERTACASVDLSILIGDVDHLVCLLVLKVKARPVPESFDTAGRCELDFP